MDQSLLPSGWEFAQESIEPTNQLFSQYFSKVPRISEEMVPKAVKAKLPRRVNFNLDKPVTIRLDDRIFYKGQTLNHQINGIGIQRVIDECGLDQIFEGFFLNGLISWGRWWWMDYDTIYYFEGYFDKQGRASDENAKEYDSNGEWGQGLYVDGIKKGSWKYFNQEGQLIYEGETDFGIRVGDWKFYHENGKLKEEGKYIQGQRSGYWIEYFENGEKLSEGAYVEERRNGRWVFYQEDGSIETVKEYYMGHSEE